MSKQEANPADDPYLQKLREARKSPAVLKVKLALVRSTNQNCLIFAFEGDSDKAAYNQWVRRLRVELIYEPFPCDGKHQVLVFREMLRRDLGGLARGVYFFIDRDFDDYRGFGPEPTTTFMTDQYSIENYLVRREVLEELLKDEFHCHAEPRVRNGILDGFDRCLSQFLESTKAINFRLFVAKRKRFELLRHLPNRINNIAHVSLDGVKKLDVSPEQIVAFKEQLSPEEDAAMKEEFELLHPQKRYRGKFSLLFFMRWLELLAVDRKAEGSKMFGGLRGPRSVNTGTITLGMLASKSPIPLNLAEFLGGVN